MKNLLSLIIVTVVLALVVMGCGGVNPFGSKKTETGSNKTLTEKGVDTVVGDEKIGVPECDEVMDMLTAESNNPDDNFVTKAVKATIFNKIKQGIKQAVEDNKNNNKNGTADLAKTCKDFKAQLEKAKAEQEKK